MLLTDLPFNITICNPVLQDTMSICQYVLWLFSSFFSDGINEVKATCRLFVRLVTEDMLFNSITIRLNQLHQEAFLSPLYERFISALASIIPTPEENVYIINIQDDTDVHEQILNVSFSVRQALTHNKDVFYSQQFLRERVYLQRTLLARLSTLEVRMQLHITVLHL